MTQSLEQLNLLVSALDDFRERAATEKPLPADERDEAMDLIVRAKAELGSIEFFLLEGRAAA